MSVVAGPAFEVRSFSLSHCVMFTEYGVRILRTTFHMYKKLTPHFGALTRETLANVKPKWFST